MLRLAVRLAAWTVASTLAGAAVWLVLVHATHPPPPDNGNATGPVCWETGSGATLRATGPARWQCPDPDSWRGPVPAMPWITATADMGTGLGVPVCTVRARGWRWTVWAVDSSGEARDFCALLKGRNPDAGPA